MAAISSSRNQHIQYVRALQSKARLRRDERKLALEGRRLIADALASGGRPLLALYAPGRADYALIAQLQQRRCALHQVKADLLRQISATKQPSGIVAVFALPKPPIPQPVGRVLVLDAISDPGNLGTILRSAAAAGIELAILAAGTVDPYNDKVLRAGMGAHFRLPIVEAGWRDIAAYCRNMAVYAASASGDCRYSAVDWRGDWALVLGSEAAGLSDSAQRLAQRRISIPMAAQAESLNVASAAAVLLFEAQRQRLEGRQG